MIEWSIAACLASKVIDRVVVSTDSKSYARMAEAMGAEVPFLRPEEISGDNSTDYQFIIHALDFFRRNSCEPEFIAHIRPTTPFRKPSVIDEALNIFAQNGQATSLRSVHQMSESAYKTFEINSKNFLKMVGCESTDLDISNQARQSFPKTYIANGYVDVLSSKYIRKNEKIHGNYVLPFVTEPVGEIDTDYDFQLLQHELDLNQHLGKRIFK